MAPTGLAHGTVTAVIPPRHFEITTLRRDVETDGRHARVAFDADWAADAARRDFTINAIFLSPDGTLYDPIGGLADLRARRVRFVGDPATRIGEDVLRLLRYYRFEARFGTGGGDAAARAACRAAAHLLTQLSAERVAQELTRLLETRDPSRALQMMAEDGVLAAMLPEARRLDRLAADHRDRAATRPAAPTGSADRGRWRWRRGAGRAAASRECLARSAARPGAALAIRPAGRCRGAAARALSAGRRALPRSRPVGGGRWDGRDRAAGEPPGPRPRLDAAALPAFRGYDVIALGIAPGPRVGALLDAVERWWEQGDFAAGRAACLARLGELAKQTG